MQKVLLVDDDIAIYNILKNFSKEDFELEYVDNLTRATEVIKDLRFEVLILDIELQDGNGIQFFLNHRKILHEKNISVFMVSAHDELEFKLEAFELGAVDYVKKPFQPMELIARLKSALRKKNDSRSILIKEDIIIELDLHKVTVNTNKGSQQLELSPLEFKLFLYLVKNENHVLTRDQLMNLVWGDNLNVTDRTVDQHISKIRKKVVSKFYTIKTSHGVGYSFARLN